MNIQVYRQYQKMTNMSCSDMRKWKEDPCSKKASIGRTAINRNLRLKCKPFEKWNERDVRDAKKAISYLSRAKRIKSKNIISDCNYTKNEIALKNWAYDVKYGN